MEAVAPDDAYYRYLIEGQEAGPRPLPASFDEGVDWAHRSADETLAARERSLIRARALSDFAEKLPFDDAVILGVNKLAADQDAKRAKHSADLLRAAIKTMKSERGLHGWRKWLAFAGVSMSVLAADYGLQEATGSTAFGHFVEFFDGEEAE